MSVAEQRELSFVGEASRSEGQALSFEPQVYSSKVRIWRLEIDILSLEAQVSLSKLGFCGSELEQSRSKVGL